MRAPDQRHDEQAEEPAHQLHVEPHVAIHYVAELVRDDALQLIAIQIVQRALCDGDCRIRRRVARRECIDAAFVLENIDLRHRNAGGDRHFFHDVAQASPLGVRGVLLDSNAAERAGDHSAAGAQLQDLNRLERQMTPRTNSVQTSAAPGCRIA